MAMARITVGRLARHSATSAIAIRIAGIAITPSMTRISGPSNQRSVPARRPRTMPQASAAIAHAAVDVAAEGVRAHEEPVPQRLAVERDDFAGLHRPQVAARRIE